MTRVEGDTHTHPILGSRAPAITAPSEIPTVIPQLTRPMYSPRVLGLDSCTTRMLATINTPAAPDPVMTRPTINILNETEVEVMIVPTKRIRVDANMQSRGLKT